MSRRLALATLGVALAAVLVAAVAWLRPRPVDPPPPVEPRGTRSTASAASVADASSRLLSDAFGVVWTPSPGDGVILGSEDLRVQGAVTATATSGFGLEVAIDGEATISLPGEHHSIRFEAELESTGFTGLSSLVFNLGQPNEIAWVHHPDGSLSLRAGSGEAAASLATATEAEPAGPFVLGLSTVGRHVMGLIDGERVAKGFLADDADGVGDHGGACSLHLRGHGTVRIRRLQVSSLAQ